jgi:AcrR family transcriptional regulator
MAKAQDRRVKRTRRLLEDALLALIKVKEFDAISVQEIIDRADVGRATFYAHYDNKEDLLESGFDGLLVTLQERQREAASRGGRPEERLFAFSRYLLAHADEHREIFPAMVSQRGGALIQHLLRRLLVKIVRGDVKAMDSYGSKNGPPAEATIEFIAGGLFGLMMWWMSGKKRLSVEEMDRMFRNFAISAVTAAGGAA